MRVLSLFDGISVARVALERAGIPVQAYYASEIEQNAIRISKKNWPDIVHIGDVRGVSGRDFKHIDLLIGGSPCQDLSVAKKRREGLKGARSGLFYEYVRILREVKPKYFILENVASMSTRDRDAISEELGVEPVMIDAALVSAQSRKRLFWTNIPGVKLPEDRGIVLKDIMLPDSKIGKRQWRRAPKIGGRIAGARMVNGTMRYHQGDAKRSSIAEHVYNTPGGKAASITVSRAPKVLGWCERNRTMSWRVYSLNGKSVTIKTGGGGGGAKTGMYLVSDKGRGPVFSRRHVRSLDAVECERLQSLPDGYTAGASKTRRIATLGNAFNAEVIAHILSHLRP